MSASTTGTPPATRPGRQPASDAPVWPWSRRGAAPADRRSGTPAAPPAPRARRSPDGRVVRDERLRARRVEVRRGEGRRRLNRLIAVGVVVAVLAAGYAFTRSPVLSVRHLVVRSGPHVSGAEAVRASGVRRGDAMVDLDSGAVVHRLLRLPWVRSAHVQLAWPDTVRIRVTERTAVARVRSGRRWAVVDGTGRVLGLAAAPAAGLTELDGLRPAAPGSTLPGATAALALATALPPAVRAQVAAVEVDRVGDLALRLTTGHGVVVGSADELPAKVVAIATMLHHLAPDSFCTVDVQVPTAPTLTPARACA